MRKRRIYLLDNKNWTYVFFKEPVLEAVLIPYTSKNPRDLKVRVPEVQDLTYRWRLLLFTCSLNTKLSEHLIRFSSERFIISYS